MKRAFIVLNPVAGTHDGAQVKNTVSTHFDAAEWDYDIYQTTGKENLPAVVRGKSQQGFDLFVAVGGDGTVSAVADGAVETAVLVGIVPSGTGNALARYLDIPLHLGEALDLLTGVHATCALDAMEVDKRHFFLNLSMGVSAQVIHQTQREDKRKMGWLAYIMRGIRALFGFQPTDFDLVVDGQAHHHHAAEVVIANGPSIGLPRFRLAPDIHIDDGHLNVYVIRGRTLWDYLRGIGYFLRQRPNPQTQVCFYQADQHISVRAKQPLAIQADGDFIGWQSVRLDIVPHAVNVVVPPDTDRSRQ